MQKLAAEVEDGEIPVQGEQREGNNLYPLLDQLYGGRDSWNKGRTHKLKALRPALLKKSIALEIAPLSCPRC